jgi:hypothetical protein
MAAPRPECTATSTTVPRRQQNRSKGLPVTNPAVADNDATDPATSRSSRRALLGLGVAGATLAVSRSVSAAPSGADLAAFAIGAELSARDLYNSADGELWSVLADSHGAFAERLAGVSGVPASARNDDLFAANAEAFGSDDPSATALGLENLLAATHTELLGMVDDTALLGVIASIVASESRHAAVIANSSGASLDTTLVNSAVALAPEA